jgi:hypothetical protein
LRGRSGADTEPIRPSIIERDIQCAPDVAVLRGNVHRIATGAPLQHCVLKWLALLEISCAALRIVPCCVNLTTAPSWSSLSCP